MEAIVIDLNADHVEATPQQVQAPSGTRRSENKMCTEQTSSGCRDQPNKHTIANLPASLLILGHHLGLLDVEQLMSARMQHPLTDLDTVAKIKRAVAVALHPDKVGADAQNKYSAFNARVDELLKPSTGEEGWQRFQQILNTEADEAEEYLRHQMHNRQ